MIFGIFVHPKDNQLPNPMKICVCMDWCTLDPWKENWMSHLFMVFDKPSCNNREVPLYFLHKLWVEFIMGLHVNYFDISEFEGIGLGSTQDQSNARCNLFRGLLAPMHKPNPPKCPNLWIGLMTLVL